MSVADVQKLADAFGDALASGDDSAAAALYEPDAGIWHNTDGVTQTLAENQKLGAWLRRKMPDVAFTDARVTCAENAFVRRHRMTGTAPNGTPLSIESILFVEVSPAGKIAQMSEYLDSAALAPLLTR